MSTPTYTISFAQISVAGLGAHNFLVLKDSSGNVIHELNGLATGADGQIKPIGYLPDDTV